MTDVNRLRLQEAWQQCERHLHHLTHALTTLRPRLPMTAAALAALSDEAVQDWDQFILRFTKLQDTMGGKLYPAVLNQAAEAVPVLLGLLGRIQPVVVGNPARGIER